MVAVFIDVINFKWHRQSEVGNGTLVLLRVCETLIFLLNMYLKSLFLNFLTN